MTIRAARIDVQRLEINLSWLRTQGRGLRKTKKRLEAYLAEADRKLAANEDQVAVLEQKLGRLAAGKPTQGEEAL